jgi:hypothetical protein
MRLLLTLLLLILSHCDGRQYMDLRGRDGDRDGDGDRGSFKGRDGGETSPSVAGRAEDPAGALLAQYQNGPWSAGGVGDRSRDGDRDRGNSGSRSGDRDGDRQVRDRDGGGDRDRDRDGGGDRDRDRGRSGFRYGDKSRGRDRRNSGSRNRGRGSFRDRDGGETSLSVTARAADPAGALLAQYQNGSWSAGGGGAHAHRALTTTVQVASAFKAVASDGSASALFGYSIATSGSITVVGAIGDNNYKGRQTLYRTLFY